MSSSVNAVIAELKAKVHSMEGSAARWPMPTHPALSELLELRSGAAYCVQAPSLAMLVMAGPSAAGAWSAVVGVPQFGIEAAQGFGVKTDRLVSIPEVPHGETLSVLAALIDVVDVIVVSPTVVSPRDAARLTARMREKQCVIVTWGAWPQAEAHIGWSQIQWEGLGQGHGNLQSRQVTLEVRRGDRVLGRRRLWFPDKELAVRPVEPLHPVQPLHPAEPRHSGQPVPAVQPLRVVRSTPSSPVRSAPESPVRSTP